MDVAQVSYLSDVKDHPRDALRFLRQCGCDLDAQADDGKTALIIAAHGQKGRLTEVRAETVQTLIDLGVDLDLRDSEGYTALMYAVAHIAEGEAEKAESGEYETVNDQTMAVARKIAEMLRNAGASEEGLDNIYLWYVVAGGDFSKVKQLIERGANINFREPYGYPIINAALRNPEMLGFLLAAGANPNGTRPDRGKDTTLHFAIRYNKSLEAVKKLVEAGADINAEGTFGTPLEYAARLDDKEIFNYLKKQGAKNMYARERGLATDERDLTAVLVHADIDSVAQALVALLPGAEHQPGIQNENVRAADECYLIYQLDGHAWTHLHPAKAKRGESLYGPELAKKLSKKLDTRAIFFENDAGAAYIGYQLFEQGKRTEDAFLGAKAHETAFLWQPGPHKIGNDEEDLVRARSTRRKLRSEDLEDPDFFDRFLREEGAYLPAWSEKDLRIGKSKRYFAKLDPDIFVRVDFVRRVAAKG